MITKISQIDLIKYPKYQIVEETLNETELSFHQENNTSNKSMITLHQNCISKIAELNKCVDHYKYAVEIEAFISSQSEELVESIVNKVFKTLMMDYFVKELWRVEYGSILTENVNVIYTEELLSLCQTGKIGSFTDLTELWQSKFFKLLPRTIKNDLEILNEITDEKVFTSFLPFDFLYSTCTYFTFQKNKSKEIQVHFYKTIENLNTNDSVSTLFLEESHKRIIDFFSEISKSHDDLARQLTYNLEFFYINEVSKSYKDFQCLGSSDVLSNIIPFKPFSLLKIEENLCRVKEQVLIEFASEVKKQYLLNENYLSLKTVCRRILHLLTIPLSYSDYNLYIFYKNLK